MIITASVAVDVRHPKAKKEYTYLIPEELVSSLNIGDVVCVPFNNVKISGVITGIFSLKEHTADYKLKKIIRKEIVSFQQNL